MSILLQDLRYGARMLRKTPGLTLTAALIVGIGISANATIFSFVDAIFYRPLSVQEPERLIRVYSNRNGSGYGNFSYPEYVYFRDHNTTFESLAVHYSYAPLNIIVDGDTKEAQGAVVSAGYFAMLGVRPREGRFFLPEEDAVPDRNPVAVISFDYWQRGFGGDAAAIGKQIRINGTDFQIIGVAPEDFRGVVVGTPNDVWIPSMMLRVGYRWCDGFGFDCDPLVMVGRLAPSKALGDAQADLSTLAAQLAAAYPASNKDKGVTLVSSAGAEPREQRDWTYQMQLLMTAASLLLLIASANVAGLLVVRATARRKEIAVRMCIGAGRTRLIRQLLTESLLLALLGGALGLIISLWAKDLLLTFYAVDTEGYTRFYNLTLNPRVVIYSMVITTLTGLLFGVIPAFQSTRQDLTRVLKDEGVAQGARHGGLRGVLVVGQVALSLILLIAAGLLVRSETNVKKGMNFDPTHVALLRLRPRLMQYSPEKAQAFTAEVVRRLSGTAGVESVSLAKGVGLAWRQSQELQVNLPERTENRPEDRLLVPYHEIAPRFFETLKIPILQGRDFDASDRPGSPPVAIINQTLALKMWPDSSPLGRILVVETREFQVVGVFGDAQLRTTLEGPLPFLYVPYWQNNFDPQIDSRMVIRVTGDPRAMLPQLRREIAAVDPNVPIAEDMTMMQQVQAAHLPVVLASNVLICSGAIALSLSAIGLYSLIAFAVAQRTREIGIRMALGAKRQDVLKLVIQQGMRLALIGVAFGLLAAFALTRLVQRLLYGVSASDPATFIFSSLLLAAVVLPACYLPARRAMKVDPMVALRYE